jgi:putative CocE/NonD family hydrolase
MRLSALPLLLALPTLAAAQTPPANICDTYTKREVMIPMRDGVRLHTVIYAPRDTTRPHPIVLMRTPYSSAPYGERCPNVPPRGQSRAYFDLGYIGVTQDVRGRWNSEGEFVDMRPVVPERRGNTDIDETTDTYDTVEWLIHNVPGNNGRVGVRGTSYPGFYASMAAINAHPAVKVVSPQAPVTEWMGGDDFFHNGALLLPHFFDFFAGFGRPRPHPTTTGTGPRLDHGTPDGYDFFLHRLGALANVNPRFYHDSIAFWNQVLQHTQWDDWWAARSARPYLRDLRPAMLWVGGWFDTENLWGALHAYAAAESQSPGATNRLVMGPWSHGQWNWDTGDSLGAIPWGMSTSQFYSDSIEVPFFRYYLEGETGTPPRSYEAAVFETGANRWHFVDAWPPRGTTPTALFLRDGDRLAFEPPVAGSAFDQYVTDPAHPVPYTNAITHWYDNGFMVEDQRFASRRPDVLVYATPPLERDLTIAGPIQVDFTVATSGTDQDFIVKVIDVFPDAYQGENLTGVAARRANARWGGYQMLVRGDVMRGKFRNSTARPEAFRPNAPTPLRFELNDAYHTFRAGHRIMIHVQSTWFPMIDRNPGRFMDIFRATDADFQPTTQRIYRSAAQPSRIVLPVLAR